MNPPKRHAVGLLGSGEESKCQSLIKTHKGKIKFHSLMMPFIVMDTKGGIILMKMHRGNFTLWESRLVDCVHYNRIMRSCYSVHVYSALKQGINGPEFIF